MFATLVDFKFVFICFFLHWVARISLDPVSELISFKDYLVFFKENLWKIKLPFVIPVTYPSTVQWRFSGIGESQEISWQKGSSFVDKFFISEHCEVRFNTFAFKNVYSVSNENYRWRVDPSLF
jgi:hypothetical protein